MYSPGDSREGVLGAGGEARQGRGQTVGDRRPLVSGESRRNSYGEGDMTLSA